MTFGLLRVDSVGPPARDVVIKTVTGENVPECDFPQSGRNMKTAEDS